MARKGSRSKRHKVPNTFWRQIMGLFLMLLSIALVIAWFTASGTFGDLVREQMTNLFGLGVWILPIILFYWAIVIFTRKDKSIPFVILLASILMWVWCLGFLHIFRSSGEVGKVIGSVAIDNFGVLISSLIFITLIAITAFFMFSITPATVAKRVAGGLKTDKFTEREPKRSKKPSIKISSSDVEELIDSKKASAGSGLFGLGKKKPNIKKSQKSAPEDEKAPVPVALTSVSDPEWKMPELDLLEKKQASADSGNIDQNIEIIKSTLSDFKIDVDMEAVNVGPRVTQYALRPPSGVKLTKISSLESNLALNLGAKSLRIEAPIPGKKAVGIEVPNAKSGEVRLYGMLRSKAWREEKNNLTFTVGEDIAGEPIIANLGKMPHLLIAGQTGSGKSVMINSLIVSLLYRNAPSDMKLILVDPKQVEMTPYEGIPHLLTPIITDPTKTISALKWAVQEMERRYALLAGEKMRDITSYNARKSNSKSKDKGNEDDTADERMPYIVIVIDELADLMMMASKDVEALIVRLAQKARAVGIHLVLATQRPSVNVITGLIKANVPARIAFTVASQVDSRTILDQAGAEKLLGQGDMLFVTAEMGKPKRIQGAWVTDEETLRVTNFLRTQRPPEYDESIVSQSVEISGRGGMAVNAGAGTDDELRTAIQTVISRGQASTSLLQRKMGIGYGKAAKLIDEMEERGIVGQSPGGSKPRDVLVSSMEELDNLGM
ncbi:DNA translocase FtsK 4TM domain-containing protein [Candidatus Saccharibacteria bacterium]|nr:DNA translocase FtsK 4TM domain-containing protein [Candidatus Saccharibacteria bacterium]